MNDNESASTAPATPDPGVSGDEVELMAKIERTRQEFGETVEQLATKADVKAQAQAVAARLSAQVKSAAARLGRKTMTWRTGEGPARFAVPGAITAAAIAGVVLVLARRRRR
jgi:hypothetical protein